MGGILAGAIRGLGKGMVQNAQHDMEQEQWNQRQAAQQQGQKDMELWRQELATELRQKLGREVDTKASELMAGNPKMTAAEAEARAAGKLTGNFGVGLDIETKNRDFDERKRKTDADIQNIGADNARAGETQRMQREKHTLEMGEAKEIAAAKTKFRTLMDSGDEDGALKVAKTYGFSSGEKIGRYQFKQEEDAAGRKTTAVYDSTTGMRVGDGGSMAPPSAGKPIRVKSIEEAKALPRGTIFIDANGVERKR